MKLDYFRVILLFCSLVERTFSEAPAPYATFDGKKLQIPKAKIEITAYGWEYYVDPKGMAMATEEVLSAMDPSNAEAVYMLRSSGIKFFLLEPPDKILHGFRTNINLVVQHNLKKGTRISDYAEAQKRNLNIFIKNARLRDFRAETVNDHTFYVMEYEYDSPNLPALGKLVPCHLMAFITIFDGQGYVFTAASLQKDFRIKKPLIQMVLGSIRRKTD